MSGGRIGECLPVFARSVAGGSVRALCFAAAIGACESTSGNSSTDAGHDDASLDSLETSPNAPACTPCSSGCVDLQADPLNCGACGHVCADNGSSPLFCVAGVCRTISAPRPIAPLSTSRVTTQRPLFRWQSLGASTGAVVDLCTDRTCSSPQSFPVDGTSYRLTTPLSPGVWYWRLRGRAGSAAGSDTSVVWSFVVPHRDSDVASFGAPYFDVNGDGYADLAVAERVNGSTTSSLLVFHGGAGGVSAAPALAIRAPSNNFNEPGHVLAPAGDLDGDGYADLAVGVTGTTDGGYVRIYRGGASGLEAVPSATLHVASNLESGFGGAIASGGDVNGDGYADLLVSMQVNRASPRIRVFLGGPAGISTTSLAIDGTSGADSSFGTGIAGALDVNGDGYSDFATLDTAFSPASAVLRVFAGAPNGPMGTSTWSIPVGTSGATYFQKVVANLGDVNGDGYADIGILSNNPSAYVFPGGTTGVHGAMHWLIAGDMTTVGTVGSLASAGDVDGDGFDDVVMGAQNPGSTTEASTVTTLLFRGATDGPMMAPDVVRTESLPQPVSSGDVKSIGAGDFDGDGLADVVTGCVEYVGQGGQVFVYSGASGGLSAMPTATLVDPIAGRDTFGSDLATSRPRTRSRRAGPSSRHSRG